MSEGAKLGNISFSGKDIAMSAVSFNRIAFGQNKLYMVSLVAETQRVKAIRSILNGGAKVIIEASGVDAKRPGHQNWGSTSIGRLYATEEGYNCWVNKLEYGLAHAILITRMPGFMRIVSDQTLWDELNDVRFTTPILREWLPYIEHQLRLFGILEDATAFGAVCGVLNLQTPQLDDIVTTGIRRGHLEFTGKEPIPFSRFRIGDAVLFEDIDSVNGTGTITEFRSGKVCVEYEAKYSYGRATYTTTKVMSVDRLKLAETGN
jgi:hypothetical protein